MGLTLGGGVHGGAELGVIMALQEAGIPIDMIGGSSYGSIIGSLLARERHWEEAIQPAIGKVKKFIKAGMSPTMVTIPIMALLSKKKLDRQFEDLCGQQEIEDLWINYFCIASNLSTGEVVTFRKGDLKSAS